MTWLCRGVLKLSNILRRDEGVEIDVCDTWVAAVILYCRFIMAQILDSAASKDQGLTTSADIIPHGGDTKANLHFVRRGEDLGETSSQSEIDGYDPELMSGRTLLTAEEEKKLLRKIDWRLMTLCSLIFMFKNLDGNNVRNYLLILLRTPKLTRVQTSNARIMNKGTDQNIMTQLGLTSNDYSLVTVVYYVREPEKII